MLTAANEATNQQEQQPKADEQQDGNTINEKKQKAAYDIWDYNERNQVIVESISVTSAEANKEQLLTRKAKITGFQEHGIEGKKAAELSKEGKDRGYEIKMGPVDPELGRKNRRSGVQVRTSHADSADSPQNQRL